jgi:predicted glycosyltransferase
MQSLSQSQSVKNDGPRTKIGQRPGNGVLRSGVQVLVNRAPVESRRLRIALYSHDTMGLGHMRRNLLIATALARSESRPIILMIAGAREAAAFAMPPGVDCLTLPAFGKRINGQYHARSLAVSLKTLVALRANTIRAAFESFQPDVLIVDKVPLGAFDELKPGVALLHARGHTRCVLGLRDVLDDPVAARREWQLGQGDAAIRSYYDAVWVYGDPTVYDPVREYGFSRETAVKVRYTGYLDRRMQNEASASEDPDLLAELELPSGRLVLCMVGGGQDGQRLANAFARAKLPPDTNGVIVTGPFMPLEAQQSLHRIADTRPRLRVVEFTTEPERLLRLADSVVAMGGYNTVCELLSFEKRTLIVPRVLPRREQLIRAERLRELGLLDMLHPDNLTPKALAEWLARGDRPRAGTGNRIDFGGLTRLPHLLADLLATPCPAETPRHLSARQDLGGR